LPDQKQKCFVLMPFEASREKYYVQIYSPAIDDAGLSPRRGDSLFRSSPIMGDIWKFVQESMVLLADLTGRNANVFYELGLAHAIGKPVVLVAETMDDVPFDLRGLRVLTFDRNNPDWGQTLRTLIAAALKETLADVLGAVPSMFIRSAPSAPSAPTEGALEAQVRALAEEITALRRERNLASIGGPSPAAEDVAVAEIAVKFWSSSVGEEETIRSIQRAIETVLGAPIVVSGTSNIFTFALDKPIKTPQDAIERLQKYIQSRGDVATVNVLKL
jgi:hypothetical protein